VVELKVRTAGGVVGAGEPILDLVPAGDELVLEARVSPTDIDEVAPGSRAQVHLTAYRTRHLPRLEGVVRQVSADRLTDEATREPYYAARITVDRGELERLGAGVALTPGMPAEALIVTRERTLLGYLLAPVADVLRGGCGRAEGGRTSGGSRARPDPPRPPAATRRRTDDESADPISFPRPAGGRG
jgi:HlyD family secretion protein/epimerase transport system membrane fusion protein